MNNYSEITKVLKLRQAMGFIYALCASMLYGVLPSIRFGLVSLRSLLLNVFWILEASRPNLSLMMSCAYSMLTALYCLAWDALPCLATSRPRLTLVLVLLRGQPHGFWAGFLVGCLVTAWPGLLCLLVKSLLACAIVHLALWLVPAFSEHTDTQGFSDPVILALRPAFDAQDLCSSVVLPAQPASSPTISLPVGVVPSPVFTHVMPVTPILVPELVPWISVHQLFHQIVLVFLDSYEVLSTNVKLSRYLAYDQRIVAWHQQYKRLQARGHFVPDPAMSTVRTSRGEVVYPDPGSVMLVQHTSLYPTRLVDGTATFSAASHRDLDSLYCTYCNKRRHEVVSCYKKWKDEKKAFKHLGAQPSNNWGWGSC